MKSTQPGLKRFMGVVLLAGLFMMGLPAQSVFAGGSQSRYVATTGADVGDCTSSLSPCLTVTYAISQDTGASTVFIAAGTYYENISIDGDQYIGLVGAGMNQTILNGGGSGRVVNISNVDATVYIADLTITNGNATSFGGGIANNAASLYVDRVKITGNSEGGITSWAPLTMTDSVISNNTSTNGGAGLFISTSGMSSLTRVTISDNTASSGYGAGIHNQGTGTLNLVNVTVSGNSAITDPGGGISNSSSTMNITNSTIAYNQAIGSSPGGIANYGTINFKNTIVAYNGSSGCNYGSSGVFNSNGNNLDSLNDCNFNQISDLPNTNPLLGLLADNGGYTQTHALLDATILHPRSPAVDAGSNTGCPTEDQRGMPRPKDGNLNGIATCDIGAYEFPAASFADVTTSYWAWNWIERLYAAGITGGCGASPLIYCPENTVTRAEMAIFLLRGIHGSSYTPPAVGTDTGFSDVPVSYWAAAWIKQLASEGITGGCGTGLYCPESKVSRAEMAIFLLRGMHGSSYTPPAVGTDTGFGDVPVSHWAAAWIKQLAVEGITSGCGAGNYCPETRVTRSEMAIFLVRAFNLP